MNFWVVVGGFIMSFKKIYDSVLEDFSMGVGAPLGADQGIPHSGDGIATVPVKMGVNSRFGEVKDNNNSKRKKKRKKKRFILKKYRKKINEDVEDDVEVEDEEEIEEIVPKRKRDRKLTIKQLILNFEKVFRYSFKHCKVEHSVSKGENTLNLLNRATVQSENFRENHKSYQVAVSLRRGSLKEDWDIDNIGEIKCSCPAFRYYLAYPSRSGKLLYGRHPSYAIIPNKVRNASKTPTVCKHLYSYLGYLTKKGIIKNTYK